MKAHMHLKRLWALSFIQTAGGRHSSVLKLQAFALVAVAFIAAWLLLRVIKKIVIAIIVIVLLASLALFVYLKFF